MFLRVSVRLPIPPRAGHLDLFYHKTRKQIRININNSSKFITKMYCLKGKKIKLSMGKVVRGRSDSPNSLMFLHLSCLYQEHFLSFGSISFLHSSIRKSHCKTRQNNWLLIKGIVMFIKVCKLLF